MYLSKIELTNIRCFDHLLLNIKDNDTPVLWVMIVGDNAVGKSCLLRCIAMGLCDQASAAALMKELPGELVRKNRKKGVIELTLKHWESNDEYKITTTIEKKSKDSPEIIRQKTEPEKDFPWDDIFVCGYGPQRAIEADRSYYKYSPLDAVYTLFNYESTLQNPELVFRRQPVAQRKELEDILLDILMLNKDNYRVTLSRKGMEIRGPQWEKVPLSCLSDGYRSTTNWLLDFFGWQIYSKVVERNKGRCTGTLLIDEIEQHLHPKWQRYIVSRLRKQISKIQFITTTHAPLAAAGVSDIDRSLLIHLKRENNRITYDTFSGEELKGLRVDQMLTSSVFGLPTARSGNISDKIAKYRKLFLKDKLSEREKITLNKLRHSLSEEIPGFGETEEDLIIQKRLRDELKEVKKILKNEK